MKSNYSELGEYIREVNERNSDLAVTNLLGVSMEKTFIQSVANLNGVDMSVYKVLRNEQLACKLMSVGRDEKLPVDLYREQEPSIVSSAYYVFEPKDKEELLPEYLMMWLCRPENDRYIGFISGGDVRGGISWETFCSLLIKVPSINKQREIVKEYNVIQNRIALNQQLIQKLEETAQTIYMEWFVEFEFPFDFAQGKPDENGKPYKSNGGEMVWNEEFGKEIPISWEVGNFKEDLNFKTGKLDSNAATDDGEYPFFTCSEEVYKVNSYAFDQEAIILGGNNATGKFPLKYFSGKFDAYQRTYVISTNNCHISNKQIYFTLKDLLDEMRESSVGTTTKFLTMQIFNVIPILIPDYATFQCFENTIQKIFNLKEFYSLENQKLTELKELLLFKLVTLEN